MKSEHSKPSLAAQDPVRKKGEKQECVEVVGVKTMPCPEAYCNAVKFQQRVLPHAPTIL